jgi:DDE family transposase
MYVTKVPNRSSPPAVLLRESYRDGGKVKTRTLANLSDWPDAKVEALRRVLKGEMAIVSKDAVQIERALPHGHVAAVLGMTQKLSLDKLLARTPHALPWPASANGGRRARKSRLAKLALAMIVARVIEPAAKLATARQLSEETAAHSLGAVLELGAVNEDELYAALDVLGEAQPKIEAALAKRHLRDGCLVLYDLTSSYLEGRHCELGRFGYSRDGKKDKLQIVFGLLCAADGCPVAVEVFEGNTGDPSTLAAQVAKLKERFGLSRVLLVGDRGMVTAARIREDLIPAGLDWLTALRAPAIQALAADDGPLQLSLFDDRDMAEIASPDYPGERLIVCRNKALAAERAAKREELLAATEAELARIKARTEHPRNPLQGSDNIGLKAGAVLGKRKMAKHFELSITATSFSFARNKASIQQEAALDGFYVLRTNVPAETLDTAAIVSAYKSLAQVERAFRSIKTVDLDVRPVHHRLAARVRAHVFLCMLAYYVVWHMRQALAPLLFEDHDRDSAVRQRSSPVAPSKVSAAAKAKAASRKTADGRPVHSFRTLLQDLATLTRNTVRLGDAPPVTMLASPTPIQQQIFGKLELPLTV